MIPKKNKFPMRTDFVRFRALAHRSLTPRLTIYSGPATRTRCAVVVPAKVNKRAAVRNWLRRLTFDTLWPIIRESQLDCVVVYKPIPLTKSLTTKKQIADELTSLKF